jgi:multiple sugar transport system substrate-binding protein
MEMVKKWGKIPGLLIGVLVLAVALTGCTPSGGKKESAINSLSRNDKGSLKVAYFDQQAFYMQYGNAFQAMFPNVQLEVISTESVFNADDPVAEMEKLLDEQKPDGLYLTEEQYAALAKKGKLYDLEAVVKQDEFDLNSFLPSVIGLLKAHGGGKLYGLSPDFTSQALYYNKDLFDQYGIPYPTDGMSWEEVIQLASRFPVKKGSNTDPGPDKPIDDALYGLFQSSDATNPAELIRTIGEAKGLLYADADAKTVSVDTPEWKSIFQLVTDGYKTGAISMPSDSGSGGPNMEVRAVGGRKAMRFGPNSMRFMTGQAAMAIDGPMLKDMLGMDKNMKAGGGGSVKSESGGKGGGPLPFKNINWDVVTIPTDPSQPDVSGGLHLESVFSINASSENLPAAWEFLKYANGEQLAKTGSKMSPSLSARTAFKNEAEGKNMDAFYALGVNEQILLQTFPTGFANSFAAMVSDQVKKIVDGTQTVDQALKTIQTQGQDLLTKAIVDAGQG